jgi:uroporphyrinogen decarboxylase
VLERRPGSLIVQDWKGNVCEISDEFDVTYLRSARDFVTRNWIKCPVSNRAEWEAMKRRYDAGDPGRFPADWAQRVAALRGREHFVGIDISGPFWIMREWLGFEELCMRFLTEPDLVANMVAFWSDFVAEMLERILADFVPDGVIVSEDMAYKVKAMISPALTRQYLLPVWKRWGEILKRAGCPVYAVDSDGYVGDLIPLWIEAGFDTNWPVEVAAGNDLAAYRQLYGHRMAYLGGVDKRAMAKGGREILEEIRRLEPIIRDGGYIPECDHGIPPDVSWPNLVEYGRLLAKATGWV